MVFNESLLKLLKKTPMGMIDMHDSWTNCICVAYGGKAIIDTREWVSYRISKAHSTWKEIFLRDIYKISS